MTKTLMRVGSILSVRERAGSPLGMSVLLATAMILAASSALAAPGDGEVPAARGGVATPARAAGASSADATAMNRSQLVEELRRQGIVDSAVLAAIGRVPRHEFVPEGLRAEAYENHPLPIEEGQTISQPYIGAFMTEALKLKRTSNVLEIGTGSGYQAAVLADILGLSEDAGAGPSGRLSSIETIPQLAESSKKLLARLGYRADLRLGDGYRGWPEKGPFDAILVAAAPDHVPEALKEQLVVGGILVIPVGDENQQLTVITRTEKGYREETVLPVRFVPMTGEARRR